MKAIDELRYLLAYVEGRGLQAYGNINFLADVLNVIAYNDCTDPYDSFPRTQKNLVKGALSLLRRTRLIFKDPNRNCYKIYNKTLKYHPSTDKLKQILTIRISDWYPIMILLEFIYNNGGIATDSEVNETLGQTMKNITSKYYILLRELYQHNGAGSGIKRSGVEKPFNKHTINAVLFKILSELNIVMTTGGPRRTVELTDLGQLLVRRYINYKKEYLLTTEKSYPQLGVTVGWIFANPSPNGKVIISTYSINLKLFKYLLKLSENKLESILLFIGVGANHQEESRNNKILRVCKELGVSCSVLCAPSNADLEGQLINNIHAKLFISSASLVTSANLTYGGLRDNYEFGVLIDHVPDEINLFIESMKYASRECRV